MSLTERERDAYVLACDRCGQSAQVDWVDVGVLGRPNMYVIDETRCLTPGCYDEDGSRRVALPPEPGELTREDRAWLDRNQRLAKGADQP